MIPHKKRECTIVLQVFIANVRFFKFDQQDCRLGQPPITKRIHQDFSRYLVCLLCHLIEVQSLSMLDSPSTLESLEIVSDAILSGKGEGDSCGRLGRRH